MYSDICVGYSVLCLRLDLFIVCCMLEVMLELSLSSHVDAIWIHIAVLGNIKLGLRKHN